MNKLQQAVKDYLLGLNNDEVFKICNEYFTQNRYEDYICSSCVELATEMGMDVAEAMRALYHGDLDNWFDYCRLDGNGNIESVHNVEDVVDMGNLVDWLIDNDKVQFTSFLETDDVLFSEDNDKTLIDIDAMREWVIENESDGDKDRIAEDIEDAEFYIDVNEVNV